MGRVVIPRAELLRLASTAARLQLRIERRMFPRLPPSRDAEAELRQIMRKVGAPFWSGVFLACGWSPPAKGRR